VEFFAASDGGEFLVQIEMPKMHAGTNELYDAKLKHFWKTKHLFKSNLLLWKDKLVEVKDITVYSL
jgi:hypothetical protein